MRKTLPVCMMFAALLLAGPTLGHSGPDHEPSNQQSHARPDNAKANARRSPGKDKQPHAVAGDYKTEQVLGWDVLVHQDLLADEALYKEVRDELHHQLFRITKVLPEDKVKLLRTVPIWIELNNPYSNNCQYHPNKRWLEGNGYLPDKAKCVELSNAKNFLRSSQGSQPYVMLHELAHAYHDQHLSFNHDGIIQTYKQAKAEGGYDQVLHIGGRKVKAYAMTDHKEYFAEASEAYFGTNDHYPFVRSELKEHDPAMYKMVREVWGIE